MENAMTLAVALFVVVVVVVVVAVVVAAVVVSAWLQLGSVREHFKPPSVSFKAHKKTLCAARVGLGKAAPITAPRLGRVRSSKALKRLEAFQGPPSVSKPVRKHFAVPGWALEGCFHHSSKAWKVGQCMESAAALAVWNCSVVRRARGHTEKAHTKGGLRRRPASAMARAGSADIIMTLIIQYVLYLFTPSSRLSFTVESVLKVPDHEDTTNCSSFSQA